MPVWFKTSSICSSLDYASDLSADFPPLTNKTSFYCFSKEDLTARFNQNATGAHAELSFSAMDVHLSGIYRTQLRTQLWTVVWGLHRLCCQGCIAAMDLSHYRRGMELEKATHPIADCLLTEPLDFWGFQTLQKIFKGSLLPPGKVCPSHRPKSAPSS